MIYFYKVIFSNRKTLAIQVKDGEVIVRAPWNTGNIAITDFVEQHTDWIRKKKKQQMKEKKNTPVMTEERKEYLIHQAKLVLKKKTAMYASKMGVKYRRVTITAAKTRFGSCSSKGNICYSFYLMEYPEEAMDYVVVHELAHRIEMNHSERFYAIVESVLPDYKKRRELLKKAPPHTSR